MLDNGLCASLLLQYSLVKTTDEGRCQRAQIALCLYKCHRRRFTVILNTICI